MRRPPLNVNIVTTRIDYCTRAASPKPDPQRHPGPRLTKGDITPKFILGSLHIGGHKPYRPRDDTSQIPARAPPSKVPHPPISPSLPPRADSARETTNQTGLTCSPRQAPSSTPREALCKVPAESSLPPPL